MKIDIQATLINIIKDKIGADDSIGRSLAEVLNLSQDAVYRRTRGETAFTIFEIQRICSHYEISFDSLLEMKNNRVTFQYNTLSDYDFSLDSYVDGIYVGVKKLKDTSDPRMVLTIKDTPIFQLLNFPHLFRFKLYFWAKSYLNIDEYKGQQFAKEKISEKTFNTGKEVLQIYNSIPSKEIYDIELLRGFIRQIQYYFNAYIFKEPAFAIELLDHTLLFVNHLKTQATIGKKFMYGTEPPFSGNDFEMYYNETLNTDSTFYYKSTEKKGLYLTHNMMNYLQTRDQVYVEETELILDKLIANSSLISSTNERERNFFFHQLERTIIAYKQKIETDLTI